MQPAIRANNLSKEYYLGASGGSYRTLRESILGAITAPWRRLRQGPTGGTAEGPFSALRDVSFEVEPGEVVGVIGRNGAGKSTLLKILSRITEPTAGRVELRGRIASLLEVGTGFHPELTGRENIFLNGAILGMSRQEIARKFDEIVAFSEIEAFLDTPVKRYSSGMYVRLAFAVAAHLQADILVIDEVLAVGDAAFQKKCLGKMSDVAQQGRTILFVSHNVTAVEALCKTGIMLEQGRVVGRGSVHAVLREYLRRIEETGKFVNGGGPPGACGFAFNSVELLLNGERPTDTLQTGDSLLVRVTAELGQSLKGLFLGVGFLDEWGRVLCSFHGKEAGLTLDEELQGPLQLEVRIPNLLLLPGQYRVRLVAVGREGHVLQDIPSALRFHVLPRDFSGHAHPYQAGHGMVLMPFHMRALCNERQWDAAVLAG